MSRVGKMPINIPDGVTVNLSGSVITAENSGKKLQHNIPEGIQAIIEEAANKQGKNKRHRLTGHKAFFRAGSESLKIAGNKAGKRIRDRKRA